MGGGGSILTIPVLVYLFGISPLLATSYSLFVVGSTSLVGAYNSYRSHLVCFKTALLFGASSIATVFITRKWIMPHIPELLFDTGRFVITKPLFTMLLFALLMVWASVAMIKEGKSIDPNGPTEKRKLRPLFWYGIGVGMATGLLGAGGGFLIIPALVVFVGLPMKKAVGTSLLIIALNSLIGFTGDLGQFQIDWAFLFRITAIAMVGIVVGTHLGKKIEGGKLERAFGWFVLVMGIYILVKEVFFNSGV